MIQPQADASLPLLLDGLKVLDLSRLLPGPFCSLLLADMGADVIKVEDVQGGDYARYYPPMVDELGAFFASLNRNKRSLSLNLKSARGVALLEQLIARSDVLLESFRPGVLARLGLDAARLEALNPKLITCAITGYGQDGPLHKRAGHDLNYLALSGVLEDCGGESGLHPLGVQIADIAGGALYAALGITSALWRRERTGLGCQLDISMTEGALSLNMMAIANYKASGALPRRHDELLSGGVPAYRIYDTADARQLAVGALEPKFWSSLVEALELPQLASEGLATGARGQEVAAQLQAVFKREPLEVWVTRLSALDACVEPVLRLDEVLDHELFRARQLFFTLQGVQHTRSPLTPQDRAHSSAPALGQDTAQILRETLGLDDAAVAQLEREGVVRRSA